MTAYQGSYRQRANDESKAGADNDRLEWDRAEDELLQTWDRTEPELDVMAEILGRTREACRQRYYDVRSGRAEIHDRSTVVVQRVTRLTHTTVTVSAYYYERWPDADEYDQRWYR